MLWPRHCSRIYFGTQLLRIRRTIAQGPFAERVDGEDVLAHVFSKKANYFCFAAPKLLSLCASLHCIFPYLCQSYGPREHRINDQGFDAAMIEWSVPYEALFPIQGLGGGSANIAGSIASVGVGGINTPILQTPCKEAVFPVLSILRIEHFRSVFCRRALLQNLGILNGGNIPSVSIRGSARFLLHNPPEFLSKMFCINLHSPD